MSGTGRLTGTLGPRTRRVVYGESGPEDIRQELGATTTVDLAHVVMLTERGLLPREAAAALLRRITALRADGFGALHDLPAPRGLYLMYEGHLVAELGAEIGGKLHTGRSRNDIKATITALRLRAELTDLLGEVLRLQAVLLSRARAHRSVVMPVADLIVDPQVRLQVVLGQAYQLTALEDFEVHLDGAQGQALGSATGEVSPGVDH